MFIALCISEDFHLRASRLLEKKHHAASVQLKKYLEDTFHVAYRSYSTTASEVAEDLQLLGCEELEGLSYPRPGVPNMAHISTMCEMRHISYPYRLRTSRNG